MFKKATVVMLATNQKAENRIGYYKDILSLFESKHPKGNKILFLERSMNGIEIPNQQHLYIVSNDEIKEGDWYLDIFNDSVIKANINSDHNTYINSCKKIIATTDKSLKIEIFGLGETAMCPLPHPSQSFIEKYVSEYNKGNIITDVLVEYEQYHGINTSIAEINAISGDDSMNWKGKGDLRDFQLKVSKDNTITIKKVKDSWTREEVNKLCIAAFNAGHERGYSGYPNTENWTKPTITEWIEQNL